ncbi:MAG: methyltransferase domain-containing protein [Planctomycetota bacterium]
MAYLDFLSITHNATTRDYLARVNDPELPKAKAAELAKQWGHDYWDGDRRVNYGGYTYRPGWWQRVSDAMQDHYQLQAGDRILDVGCGKGFLLYDWTQTLPGVEVTGLDISEYALEHAKPEIQDKLTLGTAAELPYPDDHFDLVYSINTLHNLHNYELYPALQEIQRVSKRHAYVCVESYRNESEKTNLLYWQVTCEAFNCPDAWQWWFDHAGYTGDHSFIFFE